MQLSEKADYGTVGSDLERALHRNAAALAMYEAMGPKAREKLRQRAALARTPEELDAVVDAMAGWQRGHPPYQL